MITCQLTKLEVALDQVRKAYPKLKPADAALLAEGLVLTGRHALALYEGEQFSWPTEYEQLTKNMVPQLEMVQQGIETTKKAKTTTDEEPIVVTVGLAPNLAAGEKVLEGRNDLKSLLGEALKEGVEFVYSPLDIGWQWALDRANWNTISGVEISRRIKIKASFTEGAVGIEMGAGGPKRRAKAKPAPVAAEAQETPEPADAPAAE